MNTSRVTSKILQSHLLITFSIFIFLYPVANTAQASPTYINSSIGTIEGIESNNIKEFRGIPFAEPPIGALRFKAPIAKHPVTGIIDATDFGPACIQAEGYSTEAGISEDCLHLNIWAPSNVNEPLPVIVFIHGGSYVRGSNSFDLYWGNDFAQRSDVVFVSINYRLGLYGFLEFSHIGGESYFDSANNALRDQMLALDWVKQNIASVGGDTNNITVMGQSAGGGSIAAIMGTDKPTDYFSRAIIMSRPSLYDNGTAMAVAEDIQRIGQQYNLTTASDWLNASNETLLSIQLTSQAVAGPLGGEMLFGPVYGELNGKERLLPELPEDRFKAGHAQTIDLLIGTTMEETRAWAYEDEEAQSLCNVTPFDNPLFEDDPFLSIGATILIELLRLDLGKTDADRRSYSDGDALLALADELFFRIPTTKMARSMAQGSINSSALSWLLKDPTEGKVFSYIFDYEVNFPEIGGCFHNSAPHSSDLAFVFGKTETPVGLWEIGEPRSTEDAATRAALEKSIQDAWVNFAATGNPNVQDASIKHWPEFSGLGQEHMVFRENSEITFAPFWLIQQILLVIGADELSFD